jgi:hypothetical protein
MAQNKESKNVQSTPAAIKQYFSWAFVGYLLLLVINLASV